MSIDPTSGVRKQDGTTAIISVAGNVIGRDIAWDWLRGNWVEISGYFDTAIASSTGKIVLEIASDFNTEQNLKELKEFYEEHKDSLGTASTDVISAIQYTKANIRWMENNFEIVSNWFKNVVSPYLPK